MAGAGFSSLLFYGGLALMGCASVGAILAYVVFHFWGKQLTAQLDKEYGEKRHK